MGEFYTCDDLIDNYGASAVRGGVLRSFEGSIFLLQIFYLVWWQKFNQKLALEGDEASADAVVLPVYRRLLRLTIFALFSRSILFFFAPISDTADPWFIAMWAFFYIFLEGLEGTIWIFLLLQRSSGKLAVLRALLISLVWSLYISSFWIGALVSSSPWNYVCLLLHYGTFLLLMLIIYIYLLIFPRPRDSLKILLLFWIVVLSLYVLWLILEISIGNNISDCFYLVSQIPHDIFYPIALYSTLRKDSRYWRKLGKAAQAKTIFSGAPDSINTTTTIGSDVLRLYESLSADTREIENLLSLHACMFDFAQIAVVKELDRGASAIVKLIRYKGKLFALKTFTCRELTAEMIQSFCKEVFISTKVSRHPNVCRLQGVSICPPRVSLVLEYCSEGSLKSLLRDDSRELPWSLRLKFALDAAKGICYLHSERIVHRDLKSSNILVHSDEKGELIAKVADFGEARGEASILSSLSGSFPKFEDSNLVIGPESLMTTTVGTPNYSAPELLTSEQQYSPYTRAVDCYSFGIILWEIYTREIPWSGLRYYQVRVALEQGQRPPIPDDCPTDFSTLIQLCWHEQPSQRPEFAAIVSFLEVMYSPFKPRRETSRGTFSSMRISSSLSSSFWSRTDSQSISKDKKSKRAEYPTGASEGGPFQIGIQRNLTDQPIRSPQELTTPIDEDNDDTQRGQYIIPKRFTHAMSAPIIERLIEEKSSSSSGSSEESDEKSYKEEEGSDETIGLLE